MIISLVVAASSNNVIGKNNRLLWHLPNDLRFFKNTTWAMPVIMGRKTFEAVGKPLNGRTNIVISAKPGFAANGIVIVTDLQSAIDKAKETDAKEVFVIGGGQVYEQSIHKAQKVYLTRVHEHLEGDTFFPPLNKEEWKLFSNMDFPADDKHAYAYSFQLWLRSNANT